MNDAPLNWSKIRRTLPRSRRFALDRAPTEDEIRTIIANCDERGKALTLIFVSSGIREGAIQNLKVSDLQPIKEEGLIIAGRLTVYSGEEEQYTTFISKEAYDSYQEYLNFRKIHGEEITKDSPLFRDKFDSIPGVHHVYIHNAHVNNPLPMTSAAIRKYYNYLFHRLGFRQGPKRRHEFSVHGFRKFFKTKSELAGMKPINVETLMGHSTGVSDSYYRPLERDLLEDYQKAIPYLTVSQEKALKQEVERLKVKNEEIDIVKKNYIDLKLDHEKTKAELQDIYKYLHKRGDIKPKEAAPTPLARRKRKKLTA